VCGTYVETDNKSFARSDFARYFFVGEGETGLVVGPVAARARECFAFECELVGVAEASVGVMAVEEFGCVGAV
jgi:hypothetical protein